jgi:hypothetical protein
MAIIRSTTSEYMPPPPGKVLFAGGTFNSVMPLGLPPQGQTRGPNIGAPRVGTSPGVGFVNGAPIIG